MPKKKGKSTKTTSDKPRARRTPKMVPSKKRQSNPQTRMTVRNLSDIRGNVNVAGGNITTHHTTTGLSEIEIERIFDRMYTAINSHPATPLADKEDIKAEVKEIQLTITEAAQKNENVDEGFLSRRFRSIARMAPDVLDVIVATLGNPLGGLGIVMKKIAEKAKEETKGD